jgi:hypothetical protein
MSKIYDFWQTFRYKLGIINVNGDSIRRLKQLHRKCVEIKCGNKMNDNIDDYDQCCQPEVCFVCPHYMKATITTARDYVWSSLK